MSTSLTPANCWWDRAEVRLLVSGALVATLISHDVQTSLG